MAFHLGAQNVRIEDNHILRAALQNQAGQLVEAEFDLDSVIGISSGNIGWGGTKFSESAEAVTYVAEAGGQVPVLRARVPDGKGNVVEKDVNLSEKIQNKNGAFVYV